MVLSTGQTIERHATVSALELAARAARRCLDGAPGVEARIQLVSVVDMMSEAPPAPAAALARHLRLEPERTEVTTVGGNSPQWLVNRAATAVAAGELQGALVVGAESQRSAKLHGSNQPPRCVHTDEDAGPGRDPGPDAMVGDDRSGVGGAELSVGLVAPVHVYALFESVIARRVGHTPAQHRAALGALMAPFTEVAVEEPRGLVPRRSHSDRAHRDRYRQPPRGEPYPKRMCAVWSGPGRRGARHVAGCGDVGAGPAEVVFCWSGAEATDVWFPSLDRTRRFARPRSRDFSRYRRGAAGHRRHRRLDLYSCFPCVVEMAVEALGITGTTARGLTVTGGSRTSAGRATTTRSMRSPPWSTACGSGVAIGLCRGARLVLDEALGRYLRSQGPRPTAGAKRTPKRRNGPSSSASALPVAPAARGSRRGRGVDRGGRARRGGLGRTGDRPPRRRAPHRGSPPRRRARRPGGSQPRGEKVVDASGEPPRYRITS